MRRIGGLVASLALHALMLAVVAQAVRVPVSYLGGLLRQVPAAPPAERVVYLEPGAGGGGAPAAREPDVPTSTAATPVPIRAPSTPPSVLPPVATPREPAVGAGSGGGRGAGFGPGVAGGPAEGLQPAYSDPRVWARPEPRRLPSTVAERIDSMITADLGSVRDSIAAEAERRRAGDWTFDRNGRRYGLDERFIHLGRLTIPTALLGMLPIKAQANPIAVERDRKFSQLSREVREQANRLHTEADFREAVRMTRERKDRERAERRAQAARAGAEGSPDR